MKRLVATILMFCIILSITCSCSSEKWKPDVASDDIKPYAEKTLSIIEQYLSFDIDADTAEEKIEELYSRLRHINLEEDDDKYNKADTVIIQTIEDYADYGVSYKSDTRLKQTADILRVQIGKKPSNKKYDPTEFRYGTGKENLHLFIDAESSTAVYTRIHMNDESYTIDLSFDAMYGTPAKEIASTITDVLNKAETDSLSISHIWVNYCYYGQDVFTVSLFNFSSNLNGHIYLDSVDEIFADFNSEEELTQALDEIVKFVAIK